MTLEELFEAVMREEPGALNRLLHHLSHVVHRYFCGHFDSDRAADLTQDTLVVVAKKLHEFEGQSDDLIRWVFGIARLEGREARRQQRRYEKLRRAVAQVKPATLTNLSSRLEFVERLEMLEGAVEKLSEKQRRAIANELADGDAGSLAKQEGIAVSSARARKARAHRKLRRIIRLRSERRPPLRWTADPSTQPPAVASASSPSSPSSPPL